MTPLLIANWKMNGGRKFWRDLTHNTLKYASEIANAEVVICPPMAGLADVSDALGPNRNHINLGAQNISEFAQGAHTGETGAEILKEFLCTHAIIGHSERRIDQKESGELLAGKVSQSIKNGICAVLCVGETLSQRENNETINVIDSQILEALENIVLPDPKLLVIAYEPIWAIGAKAKKSATLEDITEVFRYLRACMVEQFGEIGYDITLCYGGNVSASNVKEILQCGEVGGVLVGSASLQAESFVKIAKAME